MKGSIEKAARRVSPYKKILLSYIVPRLATRTLNPPPLLALTNEGELTKV